MTAAIYCETGFDL